MCRGQDQIVSEGLIVAVVHLLFAASMVLCYYSASRRCYAIFQYIGMSRWHQLHGSLDKCLTILTSPHRSCLVVVVAGVTLSLALACFFLEQIFTLYTMKTRWYSPNSTMPDYVSVVHLAKWADWVWQAGRREVDCPLM